MARTSEMPRSVHSHISVDAVGEALLKHYTSAHNPWFDIGLSDQETYFRRRLPWAGKSYSVSENGNVSGPNAEALPENLKDNWRNLASAARSVTTGPGSYGDLETLHEDFLTEIGDRLRSS